MNIVDVCAQTIETPREVYTSVNSDPSLRCKVLLPAVASSKVATPIEINLYGKNVNDFKNAPKGTLLYLYGAKLRFDIDTRTHSLHGGAIDLVTETFKIKNKVTLAGRCIKNIDVNDPRVFRTTSDGTMICNQTLSVNTGRNQADLFNFYAINKVSDRLRNAELLANFTRKGIGITITGKLVTGSWIDKETKEKKTNTKIQVDLMTLAPKSTENISQEIKPQTTVANEQVVGLWGGQTIADQDVWNQASGGGLPDLPGQYGAAPNLDEIPF